MTDTLERMKRQAQNSEKQDSGKPCFGIVVPPSSFTVPAGWEFVLKQPFEGVSYIATVLYNAGFRVRIIDVRFAQDPIAQVLDQISSIDVLGITTYEDGFLFLEDCITRVKERYPEMKIILGGSLVTSTPATVMNNTKADIAVLGEGELTILELMDLIASVRLEKIGLIKGLCYKDSSGNLVFTEKRPQMKDLDSLPVMDLSFWPQVQKDPKLKEVLISHSRGCYMNCSFCYRTTPQLSEKSVGKFREELRVLYEKHKFEFLYFIDLTFCIDKERTLKICKMLEEFKVRWSCMTRVQNLDASILEAMKKAGCQVILYGFESLDQNVLNKAHKGITPEEIKEMMQLTQKIGIQVAGLFILGLPGETKESIQKVISFIRQTKGACRVKYLSALPGTEIYRSACESGIIKSEVEHLRWLSKERGQVDDEFLNFTELDDEYLRRSFKEISSMYIKGPQMYEAWA